MAMRFADNVAIVTGGASGIGREVARRLVEEGARMFVADRDLSAASRVVADLAGRGPVAEAVQVDVADPASVDAMVEHVVSAAGRIDILVHSAGVGVERLFLDMTREEWARIIDVDLTGTFLTCQAVARKMIQREYGRILTMSSTAGVRGGTGRAAYGAAKAGVISLTQVMAVELAPYGVTANTLTPGAIETELVRAMHSAETREVYTAAIPANRYGTPDEVASAALFLVSEEARYITGHALAVDGGFLAAGVMKKSVKAEKPKAMKP
jgi:NAD(P)-dependent dehydrogenase (short-subunit alcohol dehydrogenase family)